MTGPNLAAMAWRNLWRHRRRTVLTLASMAFGMTLAVLFTGIGDEGYARMIELAAKMDGGHVTVQHPEMLDTPSLKHTVMDTTALANTARADPQVSRVVTRINGQVLLATARQSKGAAFIAFDPKAEDPATFSLLEALHEGEMFASSQDKGIILGERLADHLGVKLGKKVVLTLTDKQGEIVSSLARVTGILRTGAPTIDASLCLLPLDRVRQTLGYGPDEATQVAIFLPDHRNTATVADRLATTVAGRAVALPWYEAKAELAGFIAMKVNSTLFMEVLIMLLVAAGIFNQIFVSVMERSREFGIMMAIGFSPGRLFRLVMWESLWLAIVGVGVGAAITSVPYYLGHTRGIDMTAMVGGAGKKAEVAGVALEPIWRIAIYPENAVYILVAVVGATLLSGLYPAWRSGRIVPVESIKLV